MIVMDMHAAGRLHDPPGKGLIKHGTVRTPKASCPFVVFDVEADMAGYRITPVLVFWTGRAVYWVKFTF